VADGWIGVNFSMVIGCHPAFTLISAPARYAYVQMPTYEHNQAPQYLMDHCISVSDVSSHEVSVPRHRLSTYGRRAFAVAGPTVWNSLPEDMRDPEVSEESHSQSLKRFLFVQYWCVQHIRGFLLECATHLLFHILAKSSFATFSSFLQPAGKGIGEQQMRNMVPCCAFAVGGAVTAVEWCTAGR